MFTTGSVRYFLWLFLPHYAYFTSSVFLILFRSNPSSSCSSLHVLSLFSVSALYNSLTWKITQCREKDNHRKLKYVTCAVRGGEVWHRTSLSPRHTLHTRTQSAAVILLIKCSSSMIQPPKLSLYSNPGVFCRYVKPLADIIFPTFTISLNFENFCLKKKKKKCTPHRHSLSFPSSTSTASSSLSFFCSSPSPLSTTCPSLYILVSPPRSLSLSITS